MTSTWTVAGDAAVERAIDRTVARAAAAITHHLPAGHLRTAAVIGGYGRGEGGVDREDGAPRAHNNLDLLIVTRGRSRTADDTVSAVRRDLDRVADDASIPIDVGWVSEAQLRRSPPRVMWYDVRFGHRVVAGDPLFLRDLTQFTAERIGAAEIVDLLTNRGALAVIAQVVLARPQPTEWALRTAVKSTMKALVGYGDALLWLDGRYHWSYREKARRMQDTRGVDSELRALYADAIEFRFRPSYRALAGNERAWVASAVSALERAHRGFASGLLRRAVAWADYPNALLDHLLRHRDVRDWLRRARELPHGFEPVGAHRVAAWKWALATARQRVAAALPGACYGADRAAGVDFIRSWAAACDVNFPDRLRAELGFEATP